MVLLVVLFGNTNYLSSPSSSLQSHSGFVCPYKEHDCKVGVLTSQKVAYWSQQFQMNRYISHWFLKWLFWYIINLYGKLHLLVWKFLQKGHWKGPKKGLKNVDCANWENIPIFSKWIDRLCVPQYSKIYRFIWRRMCVITHSFLKSVRFWRI